MRNASTTEVVVLVTPSNWPMASSSTFRRWLLSACTTAAGTCAAVDLFHAGKLPQRGDIGQAQVAPPDFPANRFGKAYPQSRQVESLG